MTSLRRKLVTLFLQVLPIEEYEKAKLLPIRSARLRLKLVAHWIDQLNSNW
jgi:Lon protease-like protein